MRVAASGRRETPRFSRQHTKRPPKKPRRNACLTECKRPGNPGAFCILRARSRRSLTTASRRFPTTSPAAVACRDVSRERSPPTLPADQAFVPVELERLRRGRRAAAVGVLGRLLHGQLGGRAVDDEDTVGLDLGRVLGSRSATSPSTSLTSSRDPLRAWPSTGPASPSWTACWPRRTCRHGAGPSA